MFQHPAALPEEVGACSPVCTGTIDPIGAPEVHAGVAAALIEALGAAPCEVEETAPLPQPAAIAANSNAIEMNDVRIMVFMAALTVDCPGPR